MGRAGGVFLKTGMNVVVKTKISYRSISDRVNNNMNAILSI